MRHTLALGAIVLAAAFAAAGAVADSVLPTGGFVAGEGLAVGPDGSSFRLSIGAHGDATSARGALSLESDRHHYVATAVCVVVFGNSALVVGRLKKPTDGYQSLLAQVQDNGNGKHSPGDVAIAGLSPDPAELQCHPSAIDFTGALPIVRGNFVVRPD